MVTMTDEQFEELKGMLLQAGARTAAPPRAKRDKWSPRDVALRYGVKDFQTVRNWCKEGQGEREGKWIHAEQDEFSERWTIPQSEIDYLDSTGGEPRPGRRKQAKSAS